MSQTRTYRQTFSKNSQTVLTTSQKGCQSLKNGKSKKFSIRKLSSNVCWKKKKNCPFEVWKMNTLQVKTIKCNNCFGSMKRNKILHEAIISKHECCIFVVPLVLTYFRLTKDRVLFFRPETVLARVFARKLSLCLSSHARLKCLMKCWHNITFVHFARKYCFWFQFSKLRFWWICMFWGPLHPKITVLELGLSLFM